MLSRAITVPKLRLTPSSDRVSKRDEAIVIGSPA
jgi:hypothetical protein